MKYRQFGKTGLNISEFGFGAWAIGGNGYGQVDKSNSLRALAFAEECGCNFVDTAEVYGDSESVIGEFLSGRRDKWILASKYSGQAEGLTATVEKQLIRLGVETIDFYQVHWVPRGKDEYLYQELESLKQAGKIRFSGVSLKTASDIRFVSEYTSIDGIQVCISLLDPEPFISCRQIIREKELGVLARSSLKYGFLTGKYNVDSRFEDPSDQRSRFSQGKIGEIVRQVEKFRFLENGSMSLREAAFSYVLSFSEVSCLLVGTKDEVQSKMNFGGLSRVFFDSTDLDSIFKIQKKLKLFPGIPQKLKRSVRALLGKF